MIFHCLIFVGFISFLPSTDSSISALSEKLSPTMNNDKINNVPIMELQSSKGQYKLPVPHQNLRPRNLRHHPLRLKLVHGMVNIFGWGVLLPIGIIVARHFKKLPSNNADWYSLHILSQTSGFLLGTIGWGLGLSIRSAAKKHNMSVHGILGTIIFALATLQLIIAVCVRPNQEEHGSKTYWVISHHILGYALIILIISNVYEGIGHQNFAAAKNWKWIYGAILGALVFTFLVLELVRRVKFDVRSA
nr:cytochrome b561 and DOMON domain-containing protein At5g47530-like isoform X2 [Coffea arabica]